MYTKLFTDYLGTIEEVPIRIYIILYVYPSSQQLFILRFHEALVLGDRLKLSMDNRNQTRSHGFTSFNVLRQFDKKYIHSIVRIEKKPEDTITLPISLRGVISYLHKLS